jgi:hypothetical protein
MLRAIALFAVVSVLAWAQSGPVREVSSPALIAHAPIPAFYNGYLYTLGPDGEHSSMTVFAPDGHVVATLVSSNTNASVQSIAIDSDGTLAVAWAALTSRGIDIRDPYDSLLRTIDTGRYQVEHLSFGGDHSLWAMGVSWIAGRPGMPEADYAILRKYSLEGKQTGEYLKRSLFKPGLEPGIGEWQHRRITVTDDRVGVEVFSGTIGTQKEWVELGLNGSVTGRWTLDPAAARFPGVVLTSDNQAYVERFDQAAKRYQLFRLNRAQSSWEPVEAPNAMLSPNVMLYGSDGRELVFGRPDGVVLRMSWYPQPAEVSR